MISEILTNPSWLGPLVWQSTFCLAAGLGASFLLRRHAVRAHQVLLLGLAATMLIPVLSQIVRQNQWGLLGAERAIATPQRQSVVVRADSAIADETVITEPTRESRLPANPQAVPPAVAARFEWTRAFLPAWLAISSLLLARLAMQFLLGRRLARQSHAVADRRTLERMGEAKAKLGLETDVEVRASACIRSPIIWCWGRRATLLIPADSCGSNDRLDWVSVVCHELAHAKRRDHISGLFAELMVCVLPWQPLLWWARQRLAALSEEACDDWVIASGQRTTSYARTLLNLTVQSQAALLPGVVTNHRGLAGRVRRILEDGCGNPRPGPRWTLAVVALAGSVSLGLAFAQTRPASVRPTASSVPEPIRFRIPANPPKEEIAASQETILLRLVDPNGRPVTGARVGKFVAILKTATPGSSDGSRQVNWAPATEPSNEDGQVILPAEDFFRASPNKIAVCALHEQRRIGAIHEIVRGAPPETSPVVLQPLCHVRGSCDSAGLAAVGMPLRSMTVLARYGSDRQQVLGYSSNTAKHDFDLPLPPGAYALSLSGPGSKEETSLAIRAHTEDKEIPVTLAAGQPTVDLGTIDLRSSKWSALIGQPAPEIGPMKEWKNGAPVTLASLRGQAVWLRFGKGVDLAATNLRRLVDLHNTFGSQRLTIVVISGDASLEEVAQNQSKVEGVYGVRGVPFRIAVDADRATFERYGITGTPADILIDPAGNVVGRPEVRQAEKVIPPLLPAQPESSPSAWRQRFDEVYRLADGEVLRHIDPPFIPERGEYYRETHNGRILPSGAEQRLALTLFWDGHLHLWGESLAVPKSLHEILRRVLRLQSYEYEVAPALQDLSLPPGDWIVRSEASPEAKLRALEDVVARELGRQIHFEKRAVEQEVLVATGRFQLHPLAPAARADKSVHVYALDAATEQRVGAGTARSVTEFLQALGDSIRMPILDRTEPREPTNIPYSLHSSSRLQDVADEQERVRQLKSLLEHVTAQTDLRFEIRRESLPVWFVTGEALPKKD